MFTTKPPPTRRPTTNDSTKGNSSQQNQSEDPLQQLQVEHSNTLMSNANSVDNVLAIYQTREGSNGYYFKSKLPFELFLEVLNHLDKDTIEEASHTCSQWRKVIIERKELWTELEVNLGADLEMTLARIQTLACRSQSSLRTLSLTFYAHSWEDEFGPEETKLSYNTQQVLGLISQLDGSKKLKDISLHLVGLLLDHSASAKLQVIEQILYFARFSAVALEHLKLEVSVSGLPANRIIACLLSLRSLEIIVTSGPEDMTYEEVEEIPSIFFGTSNNSGNTSQLEKLYLADSKFVPTAFDFPNLRSVELHAIHLHCLHELLSHISPTLVNLTLNNVISRCYPTFATLPAVLELPLLGTLCLTGTSPSLFRTPQIGNRFFTITAPLLKEVNLASITRIHNWQARVSSPMQEFYGTQLSILLRLSPSLQSLNLDGVALNDIDLLALKDAPSTLSHLTLSSPVTDSTIQSLHEFIPSLKSLDIRDSSISLSSLARLANRYKNNRSQCKLEEEESIPEIAFKVTTMSRISKGTPDLSSQNQIARDLCNLKVSSNQVQHLVNTLTIDSPPTGKSYKDFKEEILAWKSHAKFDLDITGDIQTYIKAKNAIDLWIRISEETRAFEWFSCQEEIELDFVDQV